MSLIIKRNSFSEEKEQVFVDNKLDNATIVDPKYNVYMRVA